MTIQYIQNDILIVNLAYISASLPNSISRGLRQQTLGHLSLLGCDTTSVMSIGTTGNNKPYIKLLTSNQASVAFKGGKGITIYFDDDTQLNNSFEYSKAFIKDKCVFKVLNSTGSVIAKNALVYQNGFDTAQQLPTIALASAAAASTSIVLGITADEIANSSCGSVVSEGSVILDTSGFSAEGDAVYLSDMPGSTSTTAGTETVVVGRILCVGNPGSLSVFSGLTSGANTGGSGGGGSPSTPAAAEARPTSSAITSVDNGKTLINSGATGAVEYTMDPGLADGFEITVIQTAYKVSIFPDSGERISVFGNFTMTGQGVINQADSSSSLSVTLKKVGSDWYGIAGQVSGATPIQLQVQDLESGSGIQNADALLAGAGSTTYTFLLRQEAGGMASLGQQTQAGTYTDGSILGSIENVFLEIQNLDGANTFDWGSPHSNPGPLSLMFPDPDQTNIGTGALDLQIGSPNTMGIQVPTSTTNTYWVDTDGSLFFRNSGGGSITDYATAVAAGAL